MIHRSCCRALLLLAVTLLALGCGGSSSPTAKKSGSEGQPAAGPAAKGAQSDGQVGDAGGQKAADPNAADPNATVKLPDAGAVPAGVLSIGSPAPKLSLASWFKGDQIEEFEPGSVYVIEFWATWCGPCRVSMPHISTLQKQYEGKASFVGISDETPGEVAQFMEKDHSEGKTWDEIVEYAIALDRDGQTSADYMKASGQSGIPTAFIVGKDGAIDWIGHPMGLDDPLEQVVAGTWDRAQAAREYELEAAISSAIQEAMPKLQVALRNDDWSGALAIVDELSDMIPKDAKAPGLVGNLDRLVQIKMQILAEAGRTEELTAFQSALIEDSWNNPQVLNGIAWRIATSQKEPDLDLALKAALQADKLMAENASILDTVARVYFERGQLAEAIEFQKRAVEAAPEIGQLADTLKEYEQALAKQNEPEPQPKSEPESTDGAKLLPPLEEE